MRSTTKRLYTATALESDTPPTDKIIPDTPPADEPPADEPPADEPPADPPADTPPADTPPADEPPADEPPADTPPADTPPADEPPADEPPADPSVPPGEEPPAEESPLEDNAGSVETQLLEATDAAGEIEGEDAVIDEALDTAEALEQMRISLEADYQMGGMDKHGAARFSQQLAYHSKRTGIKVMGSLPALEHFNGTNSRLRSNTRAMESLSEFITKVWEGIRNAISRSIEWFKSFWTKLFDSAEGLIERAAKLADHNQSGASKEKTFENESLAARLHIGGSIPGTPEGATGLQSVANQLLTKTSAHAANSMVLARVYEMITSPQNLAAASKQLGDALASMDGSSLGLDKVANPATDGMEAAPAGVIVWRSKELPGGKAVIMKSLEANLFGSDAEPSDEAAAAVGAAGGSVGEYKENATEFSGNAVPLLSPNDCKKTAGLVKTVGELLLKSRGDLEKLGQCKARIVAASGKIGKLAFEDKDKPSLAVFQRCAGSVSKFIDQPFAAFAMYAMNASKALLDQVEQSYKLHGKGGGTEVEKV
jgi:phiKZ-like phage internal head proteins